MSFKIEPKVSLDAAGEIDTLPEKASPTVEDVLVIEDSADSLSKKKIQIGNLPGASTDMVAPLTSSSIVLDSVTPLGAALRTDAGGGHTEGRVRLLPYVAGSVGPLATGVSGAYLRAPGVAFVGRGFTVVADVSIAAPTAGLATTSGGICVQQITGASLLDVNGFLAANASVQLYEGNSAYDVMYWHAASPTGNPRAWDQGMSQTQVQRDDHGMLRRFVIHQPSNTPQTLITYIADSAGVLRELGRATDASFDSAMRVMLRGHTATAGASIVCSRLALAEYDVDQDAMMLVRSKRTPVIVLGDSTALNSGVAPLDRPDMILRDIGANGVQVFNFATNGARLNDADPAIGLLNGGILPEVAALAGRLRAQGAEEIVVLLKFGGNDMDAGHYVGTEAERMAAFGADLREAVRRVYASCGAVKIILTQPVAVADRPTEPFEGTVTQGRVKLDPAKREIESVAADLGLVVAYDYDEMINNIGNPGYFLDGIHPAAPGCIDIARSWRTAIETALA